MQFPLSTLSWEYGQGQSLIIQADFKCFQLSVKVECWNQESLSGCYFNQATIGIRHTCVSQLCCPTPEEVWSFGQDLGFCLVFDLFCFSSEFFTEGSNSHQPFSDGAIITQPVLLLNELLKSTPRSCSNIFRKCGKLTKHEKHQCLISLLVFIILNHNFARTTLKVPVL